MGEPFILLDDARSTDVAAPARLYRNPLALFAASGGEDVAEALAAAKQAQGEGQHVAGYLAYEAGLAFEPRLAPLLARHTAGSRVAGAGAPLVWLAAFSGYEEIAAADVPGWLAAHADPRPGPPLLSPLRPTIAAERYADDFATVREAIAAGEIYQANLSFPIEGAWAGDPLAIYARLRERAAAGFGALLHDGARTLLSHSPELFFALKGGKATLQPMKGTRPRGTTPQEDAALAADLAGSAKDRAENLMIVDLMRNDISRLAEPGSVTVRDPFTVETYPTIHTMISTVGATLREGAGAFDLLRAIFPCGSITGAPKIRAMEIIDRIEDKSRQAYCGAIGRVDPSGDAAFNVAIRTLTLHGTAGVDGEGVARMGVGSGIVADSNAADEWAECLIKGAFAEHATPDLHLIETMAFDPQVGVPLIEFHLQRLKDSAAALGFAFDRHALRNEIQAFCFLNREPRRLRVLVAYDGTWQIEGSDPPTAADEAMPVALAALPVAPGDWRLRHKTTDRAFYDTAREQAEGAREVVFVREDGFITEGSFTSVFVERNGWLLTPPLARGLLPGVLRASLIAEGRAQEADLTAADLAPGFWIGNALRGLMPARLVDQDRA